MEQTRRTCAIILTCRFLVAGLAIMVCFAPQLSAEEKLVDEPDSWGIAIGIRSAAIPYATEEDQVYNAIQLIFFEKDRVT